MPLTKAPTLGTAEYLGYIFGRYTTGEHALSDSDVEFGTYALV